MHASGPTKPAGLLRNSMRKILITGIAGSGKTSVAKELSSRGYSAVDIEEVDGMFDMFRKDTGERYEGYTNTDPEMIQNAEWLCDVDRLKQLLVEQKTELAFYAGVASNMDDILPLFDTVLVLQKEPEVLVAHLKNREGTDDMGSTEESRQAVLGWKEWWEETMVDKGAILVDANGSVAEVADRVLAVAA